MIYTNVFGIFVILFPIKFMYKIFSNDDNGLIAVGDNIL